MIYVSLVWWLSRVLHTHKVAGSNPAANIVFLLSVRNVHLHQKEILTLAGFEPAIP